MADLSLPPLTLVPLAEDPSQAVATRRAAPDSKGTGPFAWPTPPLAAYPLPRCQIEPEPFEMESRAGAITQGLMTAFEPLEKLLRIQVPPDRTVLPIRFSELRQVTLKRALMPLSAVQIADIANIGAESSVLAHHPSQPYTVFLAAGGELEGQTIGHIETDVGLFLFPPADTHGGVHRMFLPRTAYQRFQLGERIGAVLVEQHAASRAAVDEALKAQNNLRAKKLGEILVASQVVSPEQLLAALDKQARMPMVRLGEALVALGHVTDEQLQGALRQQHDDRTLPLGEMLVQRTLVTRQQLQEALARKMGYPMVDLTSFPVDADALSMVPAALAIRLRVLPLMRRGGRLVVAMSDATRRDVIEELQRASQCLVAPALASDEQLASATEEAYGHITAALASSASGSAAVADPAAPADTDTDTDMLGDSVTDCGPVTDPFPTGPLHDLPKVLPPLPELPVLNLAEPAQAPRAASAKARSATAPAPAPSAPATSERKSNTATRSAKASGADAVATDNPLVGAIVGLVQDALAKGASDVHIETSAGDDPVQVRIRRDGRMEALKELPAAYRTALVARIKTLSELDVTQTRRAQEGRLNFARMVPHTRLEIGVTVLPTAKGLEDVVLRLPNALRPLGLEDLGLRSADLERLHKVIERPTGLIVVVANGRSGRTTTLHALLGAMQHPERKVVTAEERIDIVQPGARQVEVNPRQGWGYADALRAFQAADPDVILVGDLRDPQAAHLAVDAASSGRLVLAGLPGRGAADAITRLLDQGIPAYQLADCLSALHAQRLVRKQCNHCRMSRPARTSEVDEWLDAYLRHVAPDDQGGARDTLMHDWIERFGREGRLKRYHSPGCAKCNDSGHRGQVALHELLPVGREMRQLIRANAPAWHLQRQALKDGMHTLRQDAIEKMLSGVISVEEARMVAAH